MITLPTSKDGDRFDFLAPGITGRELVSGVVTLNEDTPDEYVAVELLSPEGVPVRLALTDRDALSLAMALLDGVQTIQAAMAPQEAEL